MQVLDVAAGVFPPAVIGDYGHKVSTVILYVFPEEVREYGFVADSASYFVAVIGDEKAPVALDSEVSESSSQVQPEKAQNACISNVRNGFRHYHQLGFVIET